MQKQLQLRSSIAPKAISPKRTIPTKPKKISLIEMPFLRWRNYEPTEQDQRVNPEILPPIVRECLGENVRLPELFFAQPVFFYWALANGLFEGYLRYQAWEIDWKSRHIKPPRHNPDDWGFAYRLNRHHELTGLYLTRKRNAELLKPGYTFAAHLDVSVIAHVGPSGEKPFLKLGARMREMLFQGRTKSVAECRAFFANDKNFDLTCGGSHFPNIPRLEEQLRRH